MPNPVFVIMVSFYILIGCTAEAQNIPRSERVRMELDNISDEVPQLQHKVSFSLSGVSLYEFLRALAINNKINLDIDPVLNTPVAVNFSNVTVLDLLVYLADQYSLDVFTTGNIISI